LKPTINRGDTIGVTFTKEELADIQENPAYRYYEKTPWVTVTRARIQTDLNWIDRTSLDSLSWIKFLTYLLEMKSQPTTYTIDDVETSLNSIFADTTKIVQNLRMGFNPLHYAPTSTAMNSATNLGIAETIATLSSNVLANHVLYAPGAGKHGVFFWVIVSTDNVTNVETNAINLIFHDEDAAILCKRNVSQANMGRPIPLNVITAVDDKDLEVDIVSTDGGAANHVYFSLLAGIF